MLEETVVQIRLSQLFQYPLSVKKLQDLRL